MQIIRVGYDVRGFWKLNDYAIRFIRMVKEEAKNRAKALTFWKRYGLQATREAFNVSRATLFEWKQRLKADHGRLTALNPKDRTPKRRRKRIWPIETVRMIKIIRTEHPNLGKEKIHPELKEWCEKQGLTCPSIATIGRLIADDPAKMRARASRPSFAGRRIQRKDRKTKTRKPKGYAPKRIGECLALDTIEKTIHGSRRYIITATDVYSRFAFAYATKSHTSREAALVFRSVAESFPYSVQFSLTDNGPEFMKEFEHELEKQSTTHWHTYPRCPKMNAHAERFNRTIQEEFVDWNLHLLQDPREFNRKLIDYLVWYNTKRPHRALDMRSPVDFLIHQNPEESRMRWARTDPLQISIKMLC